VGERLRRVALGLTAALLTARVYTWSEPDLEKGAGRGLVWILALLLAAGLGIAAGLIGGRFRFRWSWTDAAVIVLTVIVATSATHALDRRPAINLAWEWIALGAAFLLVRNLPRTRRESSALAGAIVAMAVAVSAYGLYQAGVEVPALQAEYNRNPARFLARYYPEIAPGSREHFVFEQRFLYSNEIYSTFALPASLAGYLVGPLVVALWVGFQNLAQRNGAAGRWPALCAAAPLVLIVLICLILTKSRSAYLGLLVGLGIMAWQSRRSVRPRVLLATGLGGLVLVTLLVIAGLWTRRLDPEVLTQSAMSLRYRWEYYQGTWRLIAGGASSLGAALASPTFWSGVGPGNFRGPYLRYKLPEASEEIQDPHNMFLEVWATSGFWALVALLAALGLGLWNVLGPPTQSRVMPVTGRPPTRAKPGSRPADAPDGPASQPGDDAADAPPCRPLWLVASAGAGWAAVVMLGLLNPFEGDLFVRWLILGGTWLAAVFLGRPLWRPLPIPAAALGAAVAAMLVNLLAAGGIGLPSVALALWSTLALGMNLRDERSCSLLREHDSRVPPFCLAVIYSAVLGTFLGAVIPFWNSEAAIAEAEEAWRQRPPDFERAARAFERALAIDRYSARPLVEYADLEQDAWVWRGAKVDDRGWMKVPFLLNEAVSPPRNPATWSLHIRRADRVRAILQRIGSQLPPIEQIRLGGEIVKETRIATALYPSSATLHARLAEGSAEISMYGDAVKEAEEALRLDRLLTPHPDKRLPDPVRKRLEARLPEWKEKAPQGVNVDRTL
jgi:O-antigen ligase